MMAEALDVEAIVIDRSAEKETLKLLFHYLVNSIDAAALLPAALSASLITEQQRSDCASEADPYKKAEKFVGHLQRAVNGDTANFRKFLKVLHITNQGSIATRLQNEFGNVFTKFQDVSNPPEDDPVFVPDELVKGLARLRVTFARFLCKYKKEVQSSSEAQEEFVETLQPLFPNKKFSDRSFQSYFSNLIDEEVSLFNITYLDELCAVFPDDVCAKTKNLVDEYEQQRQHSMGSTTVNQFRKLFPASVAPSSLLNGKVKITVKLKSYWGDNTVNELARLVDILDVPGKHLHLYQIKRGCISVICLCSITDAQKLKAALAAAMRVWSSYFVQMGVLELFIGVVCMYSSFESGMARFEAFKHAYVMYSHGDPMTLSLPSSEIETTREDELCIEYAGRPVDLTRKYTKLVMVFTGALIGGILGSVVFLAELVPGALIGTYMGARIGGQTELCTRVAMALVGALVGALVDGILGSVVPGVELVLGALIGIYAGARIVGLLTEEAGMWTIIVLMLLLVLELCLVVYFTYL